MKLILHRKTKKYLMLFLILLTGFTGFFIFRAVVLNHTSMQDVVLYEASCKPSLNYQVVLIPNEVYEKLNQEEGLNYSKKLLSYIQAEFGMDYTGNADVPLDVEYQIVAKVNGYSGSDKEKISNWSKTFPISPVKKESLKGMSWKKAEKVNFPLSGYDSFAVRAEEVTGMKGSSEVIVSMTGKVIAHHQKEDLETPFDVSMQIPLMEDVFQIEKKNTDPIQKTITTSEKVPVPLNMVKIVFLCIVMILCIAGLVFVILFTREPDPEEVLKKKVITIIKNYGSRIVALNSLPRTLFKQQYETHSMKDLIKISDDIQKPILYETDPEQTVKNYMFYIIDEDTLYTWMVDQPQ